MNAKTRTAVLVFLTLVWRVATASAQAPAQPPVSPTVDQILEKWIAASGGRTAVEKVTTRTGKGTIELSVGGITGTIEVWQKAPDKALTILDLAGIGQQREACDQTTCWDDTPQMGLREKSGAELAEARRSATFHQELRLKELYPTIALKGRDMVGTRPAYVIEATPAEGSPVRMYFDVENGLLVRQIGTRESPAGPLEIDGVKVPFLIRQITSMFSAAVRISEIKLNGPIDDAIFRKPR